MENKVVLGLHMTQIVVLYVVLYMTQIVVLYIVLYITEWTPTCLLHCSHCEQCRVFADSAAQLT